MLITLLRHRRNRHLVGPYVDGELRGSPAARVGAHLARCRHCRDEADVIACIKRSLRRTHRVA